MKHAGLNGIVIGTGALLVAAIYYTLDSPTWIRGVAIGAAAVLFILAALVRLAVWDMDREWNGKFGL